MPKTVKIFISSTFRDMNAERDVLIRRVLPLLREKTSGLDIRIQEMDLRWGITEEQAAKGEVESLCLDGIEHARPYFLCMLGRRYGWIPCPNEIRVCDWKKIWQGSALAEDEKTLLAASYHKTEDEKRLYRLDQTIPTETKEHLQRILERVGLPGAGESITHKEINYAVLKESLPRFIADLSGRVKQLKTGGVIDRHDETFLKKFYRRSTGEPIWKLLPGLTDQEKNRLEPVMQKAGFTKRMHSFFFFRNETGDGFYRDADGSAARLYLEQNPDSVAKLENLKKAVRQSGVYEVCETYPCIWNEKNSRHEDEQLYPIQGLESFEEKVFTLLLNHMQENPDLLAPEEIKTPLEKERELHLKYIDSRTYNFCGREKILNDIEQAVDAAFSGRLFSGERHAPESQTGSSTRYVMIVGEPGSGKSSLLSKFYLDYAEKHPGCLVIPWFVGASSRSADPTYFLLDMINRLIDEFEIDRKGFSAIESRKDTQELKEIFNSILEEQGNYVIKAQDEQAPKNPFDDFQNTNTAGPFALRPGDAAQDLRPENEFLRKDIQYRHVLIILDAVNQIQKSENAREMLWLPNNLSAHACIVLSLVEDVRVKQGFNIEEDTTVLTALRRRVAPPYEIRVTRLTDVEKRSIINLYLRAFNKSLPVQLLEVLAKKKEAHNPLFLQIVLEELRILSRHEALFDFVTNRIPDTTEAMFSLILDRIENDMNRLFSGSIQKNLFSEFMVFIASGRSGMNEEDLRFLLGRRRLLNDIPHPDGYHGPDFEEWLKSRDQVLREAKLSDYYMSELKRSVEGYLIKRGDEVDFFHQQLKQAVGQKWLREEQNRVEAHSAIINCLERAGYVHPTTVRELPHHLVKIIESDFSITSWERLQNLLCDLWFVEYKTRSGLVRELIVDYEQALALHPDLRKQKEANEKKNAEAKRWIRDIIAYANAWNDARKKYWKNPIKYPMPVDEAIPLPAAPPISAPKSEAEMRKEIQRITDQPTKLDELRCFYQFVKSGSRPLEESGAHKLFTIQYAYGYADGGPVTTAADRIIKMIDDTPLLLPHVSWRKPLNPFPVLVRSYPLPDSGNDDERTLCVTSDGGLAVIGKIVYDLKNCVVLHELSNDIRDITPDGKYGIAVDGLWDLETGRCIKQFNGIDINDKSIWDTAAVITPDGRLGVIAGRDSYGIGIVCIYDIVKNICVKSLKTNMRDFTSLSLTLNGNVGSISHHRHHYINLIDINKGIIIAAYSGRCQDGVFACVSQDGKATASNHGEESNCANSPVRIWDNHTHFLICALERHWGMLRTVLVSNNNQFVITAGYQDHSINVWTKTSPIPLKEINGNGSLMATKQNYDSSRIYALEYSSKTIRELNILDSFSDNSRVVFKYWLNAIHLSPSGSYLFSQGMDKYFERFLYVYNIDDRVLLTSVQGEPALDGSLEYYEKNKVLWNYQPYAVYKIVLNSPKPMCTKLLAYPDFKYYNRIRVRNDSIIIGDSNDVCIYNIRKESEETRFYSYDDLSQGNTVLAASGRFGIFQINARYKSAAETDYKEDLYTLKVFDFKIKAPIKCLMDSLNEGHHQVFVLLPDSKNVFYTNTENRIYRFNLQSEETTPWSISIEAKGLRIRSLSPDGRYLVIESNRQHFGVYYQPRGKTYIHRISDVNSAHEIKVNNEILFSRDGKYVLCPFDNILRIHELRSGSCIGLYEFEHNIRTISNITPGFTFAIATDSNEIIVMDPKNIKFGPPITTCVRLWKFGKNGDAGSWDDKITFLCPWCEETAPVPKKVLEAIDQIKKDAGVNEFGSSCLELPDKAWEEPALVTGCPLCGRQVKCNPFVNDLSLVSGFFDTSPSLYVMNKELYEISHFKERKRDIYADTGQMASEKKIDSAYNREMQKLNKKLALRENKISTFSEKINSDADPVASLIAKAAYFASLDNYSAALRTLDAGMVQHPADETLLIQKGKYLGILEKDDSAFACYTQALEINANSTEALVAIAMALVNGKTQARTDYKQAIEYFNKALEIEPGHAEAKRNKQMAQALIPETENDPLPSIPANTKEQADSNEPGFSEFFEEGKKKVELSRWQMHRPEEALDDFEKALQLRPSDTDALAYKGYTLFLLDRYAEAHEFLDKALAVDKDNVVYLMFKVRALCGTGRYMEALAVLEIVLSLQPMQSDALHLKGMALYAAGKNNDPAGWLESAEMALEVCPENTEALISKARALIRLDRYEDAADAYVRAMTLEEQKHKKSPNEQMFSADIPIITFIKPELECMLSKWDDQCHEAFQTSSDKKRFLLARAVISFLYGRFIFIYRSQSDYYENAICCLEKVLPKEKGKADANIQKVLSLLNGIFLSVYMENEDQSSYLETKKAIVRPKYLLEMVKILYRFGLYSKKLMEVSCLFLECSGMRPVIHDALLAQDPDNIDLLMLTAKLYKEIDREGSSLPYYERIISLAPESKEAFESRQEIMGYWCVKSRQLLDLGKYRSSLSCCHRALELFKDLDMLGQSKNRAEIFKLKMQNLFKMGEYGKAIATGEEILESQSFSLDADILFFAAIHLALIYCRTGDYVNAMAYYDKALGFNFDNALVYRRVGALYGKRKEYAQAISSFNRALKIEPDRKEICLEKAKIFAHMKKHKEAGLWFEKAGAFGRAVRSYHAVLEQVKGDYFISTRKAIAMSFSKNATGAISTIRKVLREQPGNLDALLAAQIIFIHHRDWNDALLYCQKALEQKPLNTVSLFQKGFCHFKLKEYEEALACLNKLRTKKIKNVVVLTDVLIYKALCYDRLAQAQSAYQCIDELEENNLISGKATKLLKRIMDAKNTPRPLPSGLHEI